MNELLHLLQMGLQADDVQKVGGGKKDLLGQNYPPMYCTQLEIPWYQQTLLSKCKYIP